MKVLAVRNRPTNNSTQSPALCPRQRCRVRLRGHTVTSSVGTRRRCGQSRGSVRAQRFLPARTESEEMERGATKCHLCTEMLAAAAAMLELLQPLLEPLIAPGVKIASEVMRKRRSFPGFGFMRVSGLAKFHCFAFRSLFFKDGQNVSDFSR